MKTNKETNILTERAADLERLRAVLRDWGYGENEIHRVLKGQRVDQKAASERKRTQATPDTTRVSFPPA